MSLAADVRSAVDERTVVRDALRAGLLNYAAAADWLATEADLDGDASAIATALRRYREDLPAYATEPRTASVSMRSGVDIVDLSTAERDSASNTDGDHLLRVGDVAVADGGSLTAIVANGEVDGSALAVALGRLASAATPVRAAAVAGDALLIVVERRHGATAVRAVEGALEAVPPVPDA